MGMIVNSLATLREAPQMLDKQFDCGLTCALGATSTRTGRTDAKIPRYLTNVVRQGDADRLLERKWRARVEMRRKGALHWLDDESEPGSWAKEIERRGIKA